MNRFFSSRSGRFWWIVTIGVVGVILVLFYGQALVPDVKASISEYRWSMDIYKGDNLYPQESTYVDGQTLLYMPLYFIVVGNLMKVFGTSPVVGKVVSVGAVAVTALLIYWVSMKFTSRRLLSVLPAGIFLLHPIVIDYSANQMKIDPLALMFSIIGLVLVFRGKVLWAVLPFALAIFTKQYFIAAPIAAGVYLLLKDRRQLLVFVPSLGVLFVGGLLLGQYLTGGTFITHTIGFLSQPSFGKMEFSRTVGGTLVSLAYIAPILGLAVYGLVKRKMLGLVGIYLIVSLVVMVATVGKIGSGINYSFAPLVASCMLGVLAAPERMEGGVPNV